MLTFDEENHTYKKDGKELQSVSAWIDQFVRPFNPDVISSIMSRKSDKSPQEIRDKWHLKGKLARAQGDFIHGSIEYYLKYDQDFENDPVRAFKEVMSDNKYHSEVRVCDDKNAGTIDLIEALGGGKVKLHDFKTNADLYKHKGRLLEPFKDLQNSPINKYRLQLTKYKELLEKMKEVEVVELNIWWYKDLKFEIINVEEVDLTVIK